MNTKQQQRKIAYERRNNQPHKTPLSDKICQQFIAQQEYQQAHTVMWYLHCRSEVRTQLAVQREIDKGKKVVVPYCTKDSVGQNQLGLWPLSSFQELQAGTWGILEPPRQRWHEPDKQISIAELDLIMVPGVAFDRRGGRLGNGAGYYDRLLQRARADSLIVGVCFESQLFAEVTMQSHDVFMDRIMTENTVYEGKGR